MILVTRVPPTPPVTSVVTTLPLAVDILTPLTVICEEPPFCVLMVKSCPSGTVNCVSTVIRLPPLVAEESTYESSFP